MNKQPKLMNFSRMRDIFEPVLAQVREHIYISNELGIVYGDPQAFQMVLKQNPPFTIDDYRLGVVVQGDVHVSVNLADRHLTGGTLVFLGPGTIINPISFPSDLKIYGVGLFADFPMPFAPGQMPTAFNGQVRDFELRATEADVATAHHIIDTIWQVVHQPAYNRQTVGSLVAALMYHYDGLYRRHTDRQQAQQSREQTLFDRFIYLVNQHCQQEHQLSFYADRLCLTERYLGTVVRQASGTTAKEWIDRALIMRIKVELRHTDKSVVQIADEMHFPNPAFFSKFFKRLTGVTPLEYRQS